MAFRRFVRSVETDDDLGHLWADLLLLAEVGTRGFHEGKLSFELPDSPVPSRQFVTLKTLGTGKGAPVDEQLVFPAMLGASGDTYRSPPRDHRRIRR